jgi:hypothetical protein
MQQSLHTNAAYFEEALEEAVESALCERFGHGATLGQGEALPLFSMVWEQLRLAEDSDGSGATMAEAVRRTANMIGMAYWGLESEGKKAYGAQLSEKESELMRLHVECGRLRNELLEARRKAEGLEVSNRSHNDLLDTLSDCIDAVMESRGTYSWFFDRVKSAVENTAEATS